MNDDDLLLLTLQDIPWASDMGRDCYGLWAEFTLGDVTQRLRWIRPGRFLMGSPEDEPGRLDNEGPQHEVQLSTGFWLFDTPVTQALWTAVMGYNLSHFIDPKRPMENVSKGDVFGFLEKINTDIPGIDLVLPTEAQWEYACRAGTDTATYAGPIEILSEYNAPILDKIAWHGGNSGVNFKLDSSELDDQQYKHKYAGTHPVGLKCRNPWGLHDMLGNVYELCADRRVYSLDSVTDPIGKSNCTVARGGCWNDSVRYIRAAFRLGFCRYGSTGFRCARIQQ